jgi:hypothetical protein
MYIFQEVSFVDPNSRIEQQAKRLERVIATAIAKQRLQTVQIPPHALGRMWRRLNLGHNVQNESYTDFTLLPNWLASSLIMIWRSV